MPSSPPVQTRDDASTQGPQDLVLVGTVRGAYGLRGWLRVATESPPQSSALLAVRNWWLRSPAGQLRSMPVAEARVHGEAIVARPQQSLQREEAAAFKSWSLLLSRSDFPALPEGEYYWIDLVGCSVVNRQAEPVGVVESVVDHGAHPILVVWPADLAEGDSARRSLDAQVLIPFVPHYIDSVDLAARLIRVDWSLDGDG